MNLSRLRHFGSVAILSLIVAPCGALAQRLLDVGPGQPFDRIEDALAAAQAGDEIRVHPLRGNAAYRQVALNVRIGDLRIIAAADTQPQPPIPLDGAGFDYSGIGSIPRAIVQFNPGADGGLIEGFELLNAHNESHNGAGVRINQANHITVRACVIHSNDMGIMSGGDGTPATAADQRIEQCLIHTNGSLAQPGYSHNLYLGGTSAVLSACEVRDSTAGHNVKSRAHYTRIEYCWIHDSANRELDLVDAAGDTDAPGSDAVVLGSVIAKALGTRGNRGVIHFGQDGGHDHRGTLHVVNTTITTPYISPVVLLSAPSARLVMANTLVTDALSGQRHQSLVEISGAGIAPAARQIAFVTSAVTSGFASQVVEGIVVVPAPLQFAEIGACDYRVVLSDVGTGALLSRGTPIAVLNLPSCPQREMDRPGQPLRRYLHPLSTVMRPDSHIPAIGAWPVP